jgi:hypothetical protein
MALRPLGLARPIVLLALIVTVATASSRAASAQQWPERRGQGICEGRVNPYFNLHPPPAPTMIK